MGWNNQNNGGGFRQPRQNFNNQNRGYQGRQGGNVQGGYRPNTGNSKPNDRRQKETDPAFKGVCNIVTPDGEMHTFFISTWENDNGSLGHKLTNVLDVQDQGNQNGRSQGRSNGGYRPQGQGGSYRGSQNYNQGPNPTQNGSNAMSRARPIPPATYRENGAYENAPPPNGPDDYNVSYDDEVPPY